MLNIDAWLTDRGGLLQSYAPHFSRIADLCIRPTTIANFGCHIGEETYALSRYFCAPEVVGIDNEPERLDQARRTTERRLREIEIFARYQQADRPSPFIGEHAAGIMALFQADMALPMPEFVEADITNRTCLVSGHYDLAYCRRVIYHQQQDPGRQAILAEMCRVLAPSGLLVAIEPTEFREMPDAWFQLLGLEMVRRDGDLYCYRKPA